MIDDKPSLKETYLAHYGVKGMKWGVRKQQKRALKKASKTYQYLSKHPEKMIPKENKTVVDKNLYIDEHGNKWNAGQKPTPSSTRDIAYRLRESRYKNNRKISERKYKNMKDLGQPPKTYMSDKIKKIFNQANEAWYDYYWGNGGKTAEEKAHKLFTKVDKLRHESISRYGIGISEGGIIDYQVNVQNGNVIYASKYMVGSAKAVKTDIHTYVTTQRAIDFLDTAEDRKGRPAII